MSAIRFPEHTIHLRIELRCSWCMKEPRAWSNTFPRRKSRSCSFECNEKWAQARQYLRSENETCPFCRCRPKNQDKSGRVIDYCGKYCEMSAQEFHFGMTFPQKIFYDGQWYKNAYSLFYARQFLPDYPAIAERIRQCTTAENAEAIVVKYTRRGYVRSDWKEIEIGVLEDVLRLKFGRSHQLREALKAIVQPFIVADMPHDGVWGNGSDGRGQNQLGKALTKLRNTLRDNT